MAYDEDLAERVRGVLSSERGTGEIKMFGGLCFTLAGNMVVGIVGDELMVRVGPDAYEKSLARSHAREMDFAGRPMNGFLFVARDGIRKAKALESWVKPAVAFVKTLPPKKAKTRTARTTGR